MPEIPPNQSPMFWDMKAPDHSASKDLENFRKGNEAALERELLVRGQSTRGRASNPRNIVLDFATQRDVATTAFAYLQDPFLPDRCVVGFFGRGSTAKSSFLATMAARISSFASTLWVSVEEPKDWIKVRHIKSGGVEGSLAVATATARDKDQQGRVVGSDFNIPEDLETSIVKAKENVELMRFPPRPLRLVVLDTAVGLTTWGRGESPNDDSAVKRLLGHLQHLAEVHDITIAIIGHSNKGRHDHFADTVAGSSAWTNSPRLSFVHARDLRSQHAYVLRVAKSNLTTRFAACYCTKPIHTLHRRQDGNDSVLCSVVVDDPVWGEDESLRLFDEATRKPREDGEEESASRKTQIIQQLTSTIVAMVGTGQVVTREAVHVALGFDVDRRHWQVADSALAIADGIVVTRGPHGQFFYQRRVG